MILLSDGPFNLDIGWHTSGSSHVKYGLTLSGKRKKYDYKYMDKKQELVALGFRWRTSKILTCLY